MHGYDKLMALNPGAKPFTPVGEAPGETHSETTSGTLSGVFAVRRPTADPDVQTGTLYALSVVPEGTSRLWRGPVTLITGPPELRGAVGRISGFAGTVAWFKPDASSRPGVGDTVIPMTTVVAIPTV